MSIIVDSLPLLKYELLNTKPYFFGFVINFTCNHLELQGTHYGEKIENETSAILRKELLK